MIGRIVLILAILAFVANIVYVWNSKAMRNSIMGNDEYFFYRTTLNLPNYETTGAWLIEPEAPNPNVGNPHRFVISKAYTTPVWVHPPIANYVAYPIAILFDDAPRQIQGLRLVDMAIILITVLLIVDIVRRHTNNYVAALSVLPLMMGRLMLANAIMFYHDLFMWLFFAVTLWVINRRPTSKWVILFAMLMVLTKINAVLLLAPILIYLYYMTKDKMSLVKVGVPSVVALFGFIVYQAVVSGNPLYLTDHWGAMNVNAKGHIRSYVIPRLWDYVVAWGLWFTVPIVLAGIILTAVKRIRACYGFAMFGIVVMLFGFGWGSYAYHVFPIVYASMFMIPVILGVKV